MINLSKGFVLRVLPSAPDVPVNGTGFCLPEHFYFEKTCIMGTWRVKNRK